MLSVKVSSCITPAGKTHTVVQGILSLSAHLSFRTVFNNPNLNKYLRGIIYTYLFNFFCIYNVIFRQCSFHFSISVVKNHCSPEMVKQNEH